MAAKTENDEKAIDIFICYRHADGVNTCFPEYIAEHLADDYKYSVYFDKKNNTSGYLREEIEKKIDECKYVIVLVEPHTFLNRTVKDDDNNDYVCLESELKYALNNNKKIIPILKDVSQLSNLPKNIEDLKKFTPLYYPSEKHTGYTDEFFKNLNKFLDEKKFSKQSDPNSVEDLMKNRLNDIAILRNLGKYTNEQERSRFKEAMWWCAGADKDLLYMCPTDHAKYVGIGTVILCTALMAMLSGGFAINMIATNSNGTFSAWSLLGLFWGATIFFLDRFITNTMYSDGKVTISWLEFSGALPRILISIFLGVVISMPLELIIFQDDIQRVVNSEQAELEQCEKRYDEIINNYKENKHKLIEQKRVNDSMRNNPPVSTWTDTLGRAYSAPYKQTSHQKHYDTLNSTLDEEIHKCDTSIEFYTNEKHSSITSLLQKLETPIDSTNNRIGIVKQIKVLHNLYSTDEINKGKERISVFSTKHLIIATLLFLVFVSIYLYIWLGNGKKKDYKSLLNILFMMPICVVLPLLWPEISQFISYITTPVGMIMMLFVIIDVSPVFYRMMVADGTYDKLVKEEKRITEDRIRLDVVKSEYMVEHSDYQIMTAFIFGNTYDKMQAKKKNKSEMIF